MSSTLPLLVLGASLVPALLVLALGLVRAPRHAAHVVLVLGAVTKLALVGVMAGEVTAGRVHAWRAEFVAGLDVVLRTDPAALLLTTLAAALALATGIYVVGYPEEPERRGQLLGFLGLCVAATTGVALAGNLVTLLLFAELITVATYPLVAHRGTADATAAGRSFLLYALAGGSALLLGVVWLHALAGPVEFAPGGVLALEGPPGQRTALFALLVAGLAVKAALVPLHVWLPAAHASAPAPASALLSGLAVKAGAFGIVRVVHDLYGVEHATELGVLGPLALLAAVTIVYGALRALSEESLKRRLAYSTVSQLSYTVLGAAVAGPLAVTGGLAHLVHQGLMKATMFYCAGGFATVLGAHDVAELRGVGRRMPVTTAAFTVASLGMIGVPPLAGFASKWLLGLGGLEAGAGTLVLPVLVGSSLLSAAYFLPILYRAWFTPGDTPPSQTTSRPRPEAHLGLVAAPVLTGVLTVVVGLFAAAAWSPAGLAALVTEGLAP